MGVFSEMDAEQRYGAGETEQERVEPFQVGQSAITDVPEPDDEAEQQAEADAAPAEMEKLMGEESEPEDKSGQAAAGQTEDEKRKAHEEAEAKRKAEFDAKQRAKKEKENAEIARVAAMSDDEVMMASMQQVSAATERLTRRNMKECVSEYVQTKCLEDPAFARLTMHPLKSMIHCFWYINRKARAYLEQEMKDNDVKPEQAGWGGDVPDELCYQWAEDYFCDPDAEEDHRDDEKFEPKPYYGKSSSATKKSSKAKKGTPPKEKKAAPPKEQDDVQLSLLGVAS